MKIENEKVIAGLSCGDVLDRLSDYLDGDLPAPECGRIEEHLRGCDGCARFGGELRGVVEGLRTHLARSRTLPAGFRERLRKALAADTAKA
ncbi:MAG TPA: anti-sigma factor [Anaeromyxobacter sp.]